MTGGGGSGKIQMSPLCKRYTDFGAGILNVANCRAGIQAALFVAEELRTLAPHVAAFRRGREPVAVVFLSHQQSSCYSVTHTVSPYMIMISYA